jgi:hypothetical protein
MLAYYQRKLHPSCSCTMNELTEPFQRSSSPRWEWHVHVQPHDMYIRIYTYSRLSLMPVCMCAASHWRKPICVLLILMERPTLALLVLLLVLFTARTRHHTMQLGRFLSTCSLACFSCTSSVSCCWYYLQQRSVITTSATNFAGISSWHHPLTPHG